MATRSSSIRHAGRIWGPGAAIAVAALVLLAGPRFRGAVGIRITGVSVAFVALVAESLPFLLIGSLIATALARTWLPWLAARARRSPKLAACLAPLTGVALPVCDCGLVPVARRLSREDVPASALNGFVAGAPFTNPVVIVSTLVAFPGSPIVAASRVGVGIALAVVVAALGPVPEHNQSPPTDDDHEHGLAQGVGEELVNSGPTLVLAALAAALVKGLVPIPFFEALAAQPLLSAAGMMVLAASLSICSQADAFFAASLPLGTLPRLVFLLTGPVLNLRVIALYRREFGRRWLASYALIVAPTILVLALVWTTWVAS